MIQKWHESPPPLYMSLTVKGLKRKVSYIKLLQPETLIIFRKIEVLSFYELLLSFPEITFIIDNKYG